MPNPTPLLALQTQGLSKEYRVGFSGRRKLRALEKLELEVQAGTSFGFLGPNGAGKSTTIKLLMGLIFPTSGSSRVWGGDIGDSSIKRRVGYSPENPSFADHLTGLEVLRYIGTLYGLKGADLQSRSQTMLERLGLGRAGDIETRKYSKGMVQRLSIAQAIMHSPELIILDEPMSGLDPLGRRDVKDLIVSLRSEGKTVFFSTHIISDVEEICDSAAILVGGEVVRSGPVSALLGEEDREVEITFQQAASEASPSAPRSLQTKIVESQNAVRASIEAIWANGGEVLGIRARRYGLEKVFLDAVASRPAPRSYN